MADVRKIAKKFDKDIAKKFDESKGVVALSVWTLGDVPSPPSERQGSCPS